MTEYVSTYDATQDAELTLTDIWAFLVRHRVRIAAWTGGVLLLVVLAVALRPRTFTASASFVPQSSDRLSGLDGLAAQLGVAAAGQDVTQSSAFYSDLLKSREILSTVLLSDYRYHADNELVTRKLIDVLDISESTEGRRLSKAIDELSKKVKVDYKARTGVVTFDVPLPYPELAQEVTQRFLDEVSRFSQAKRIAKASAERKFTEGRIADLKVQLRDAEDKLEFFLQRNRDYRNSPDLTFEHDRMSQEVDFLRTIFTTVSQSNERARMDEARDTPVIMVIERPNLPARPDSRGWATFGMLGVILGGLMGIGAAVVSEILARRRAAAA